MTKPLTMDEIIEAHLRLLAEAAHKARRETLAEVQAHVRGELDSETATPEEAGMLSLVDGFLSDLQAERKASRE